MLWRLLLSLLALSFLVSFPLCLFLLLACFPFFADFFELCNYHVSTVSSSLGELTGTYGTRRQNNAEKPQASELAPPSGPAFCLKMQISFCLAF